MQADRLILVADDDLDIRFGLRMTLTSFGFRVVEASTGVEALSQAALVLPHLILMDIRMPEMDGLEALHELKNGPLANTPVVIVSASPGDQTVALDVGAAFFLSKPFTSGALKSLIEHALGDESSLSNLTCETF